MLLTRETLVDCKNLVGGGTEGLGTVQIAYFSTAVINESVRNQIDATKDNDELHDGLLLPRGKETPSFAHRS